MNSDRVVLNYLQLAHNDYLTARHLLFNGYLEHGALLASTSAEKYLKAIIGIHNINNRDHLGRTVYKLVEKCQPVLYKSFDHDFLKFLEKAYKLRYAHTSSPGFSMVINQYRTLYGIDNLVSQIDSGFHLKSNNEIFKTPFQQAILANDERVIKDNVAINPALFIKFLDRHNKVLELKIENDFQTVHIQYETEKVNMIGEFSKIPEISMNKSKFTLTKG